MREPISPTVRWRVFLRDGFRCQYCKNTGVPLEADHIISVAHGGSNRFHNLITACRDCNGGKSAYDVRPLFRNMIAALRPHLLIDDEELLICGLFRLYIQFGLDDLVVHLQRYMDTESSPGDGWKQLEISVRTSAAHRAAGDDAD